MKVRINSEDFDVSPVVGEDWRFHVTNCATGKKYLVDTLVNAGLGFCSCENWGVVRWKNVKQGIFDPCKHQQAVMKSEWPVLMKAIKKKLNQ